MKFWAGQAISVLGSLVSRLALPFLVIYTLGATPMDVTWLRIAEILPGILVGVVAGVWVDRLPRRTVMIAVDVIRALPVGFIPLLNAVSFAVSAATLWAIRIPSGRAAPATEVSEPVEPFGRALARGARFLLQSPNLSRLATAALVQGLYFGISGAIYVLYVSRVLGVPPAVQGVLYAIGGLAALAAAHLAEPLAKRLGMGAPWSYRRGRRSWARPCSRWRGAAVGRRVFILGQQLFGGGGDAVFDIGLAAVRQGSTPNDVLGRVGSIWLVLTSTGLLVGVVGYRATLAGAVGVRVLVLALSWRFGRRAAA